MIESIEDHNFYIHFILSQMEWRKKVLSKEHVKESISDEERFYNFSIINATGLRGSGATTAIAKIFDPNKDLYVGYNPRDVFLPKIEDKLNRKILNFKYLNFNSLNLDNTNIDSEKLLEKIQSFFEDNNLEVMKVDYNRRGRPRINQVDIEDIEKGLMSQINSNIVMNETTLLNSLRGLKFLTVYIDVGPLNQRMFSTRITRLMQWIRFHVADRTDIVFVLT